MRRSDSDSTPAKRRGVLRPLSSSTPGNGNRGVPHLRPLPTSTPAPVGRRLEVSVPSPSISVIDHASIDFNGLSRAELKRRYNELVKVKNRVFTLSLT